MRKGPTVTWGLRRIPRGVCEEFLNFRTLSVVQTRVTAEYNVM